MKKLVLVVILLLLLGTLWGGASWFIGEETEKLVKQQVEQSKEKLAPYGMKYELVSYDKTFMGATAVTKLVLPESMATEGAADVQFLSEIQHGPILRGEKGVGLGSSRWKVTLDESALPDAEVKEKLKEVFADKPPFVAYADMGFAGADVNYDVVINPAKLEQDSNTLNFAGANMTGTSNAQTGVGPFKVVMNTLNIKDPDVDIKVPAINVDGDITALIGSSMVGSLNMQAKEISVTPILTGEAVTFDVDLKSDSAVAGDDLKGTSNIVVNNVKGAEDSLKSLKWDMSYAGFSIAGLEKVQALNSDVQSLQAQLLFNANNDESEMPEGEKQMEETLVQIQEKQMEMLNLFFSDVLQAKKTNLTQNVVVNNKNGDVKLDLDLTYQGADEPLTLDTLALLGPEKMAALLKGDVAMTADKAILPPMMAAMFLAQPLEQKIVLEDDKQYSFKLKLKEDGLELNDQAMSVMELMMKFAPQPMGNAGANEGLEQDGALGLDLPEDMMKTIEEEGLTPEIMQMIEESDDVSPETKEMLKQLQQMQAMEAANEDMALEPATEAAQ